MDENWVVCMQVGLEATGAEGAAPFGASASALLPTITAQASHWQLADMARLASAATGVATRMQYMHLLPPELRATPQPAAPDTPRSARVCAMWRYAVLAVRAQLRTPRVQAARAARRTRFVSRYRTYVAACSMLQSIRKALVPVAPVATVQGGNAGNTSAFSNPPSAAALLPWLLEHSALCGTSNCAGDFDATGGAWGSGHGGATEQWCGHERSSHQASSEGAVMTGSQHPGGDGSAEVWLADAAVVATGATSGVASIAGLLLDAWDRPDCCGCEVEKLPIEAWPQGWTAWTAESTHGALQLCCLCFLWSVSPSKCPPLKTACNSLLFRWFLPIPLYLSSCEI